MVGTFCEVVLNKRFSSLCSLLIIAVDVNVFLEFLKLNISNIIIDNESFNVHKLYYSNHKYTIFKTCICIIGLNAIVPHYDKTELIPTYRLRYLQH